MAHSPVNTKRNDTMQKITLFGISVHAASFDDVVSQIITWAQDDNARRYVCTSPVYTLMIAQEIPEAKQALNHADMVTADGMPVVWVQRRRGAIQAERGYGPGIMRAVFERTADTPIRHYLWGGEDGVPEQLRQKLIERYGNVTIVGADSPPFEPIGAPVQQDHIDRINAAEPHIVWVGLGSPKQDVWMQNYRDHLNAPVLIGVGAAFDFLSGVKSQAPHWMQRNGLEWLFRLMQEPRRLARRYIVYNTRFIWRLFVGRELWNRSEDEL